VIGDKEERFEGKGTDLSALQAHIEEYLKDEGFKTQTSAPSTEGSIIQAHKGGWLAGVIAADRALTITTTGSPDDFTVHIGIGKWIEHLGVTAVETLLITPLFIVVDVPEMAWNVEVENKLMKDIRSFIEGPSADESARPAEPATAGSAEAEPGAAGAVEAEPATAGSAEAEPAAAGSAEAEPAGSGESTATAGSTGPAGG
jgi:hypothetical protein